VGLIWFESVVYAASVFAACNQVVFCVDFCKPVDHVNTRNGWIMQVWRDTPRAMKPEQEPALVPCGWKKVRNGQELPANAPSTGSASVRTLSYWSSRVYGIPLDAHPQVLACMQANVLTESKTRCQRQPRTSLPNRSMRILWVSQSHSATDSNVHGSCCLDWDPINRLITGNTQANMKSRQPVLTKDHVLICQNASPRKGSKEFLLPCLDFISSSCVSY